MIDTLLAKPARRRLTRALALPGIEHAWISAPVDDASRARYVLSDGAIGMDASNYPYWADSATLTMGSAFTIAFWSQVTGGDPDKVLVNRPGELVWFAAGAMNIYLSDPSFLAPFTVVGPPSVASARRLYVLVFNGAGATNAERLRVWIDNSEQTIDFGPETVPTSVTNTTNATMLGFRSFQSMAGSFDSPAFWTGDKSAIIDELWNGGDGIGYDDLSPAALSGLKAWCPCDEASGTRYDRTANNNDLLVVGSPTLEDGIPYGRASSGDVGGLWIPRRGDVNWLQQVATLKPIYDNSGVGGEGSIYFNGENRLTPSDTLTLGADSALFIRLRTDPSFAMASEQCVLYGTEGPVIVLGPDDTLYFAAADGYVEADMGTIAAGTDYGLGLRLVAGVPDFWVAGVPITGAGHLATSGAFTLGSLGLRLDGGTEFIGWVEGLALSPDRAPSDAEMAAVSALIQAGRW